MYINLSSRTQCSLMVCTCGQCSHLNKICISSLSCMSKAVMECLRIKHKLRMISHTVLYIIPRVKECVTIILHTFHEIDKIVHEYYHKCMSEDIPIELFEICVAHAVA